jgi:hypothetical protein
MQLDDADAGDVGKEKDARADAAAAPPCGMTRLDDDSDRRQRENDEDDALGRPFRGADVDALLLGATTFPMLRGTGAAPADDGDDGHHVERDTEAKKVTLGDWGAAEDSAALLLRPALPMSFVVTSGGGAAGFCFLERFGRRKHEHLRTPPPLSDSAPLPILGRSGGGGGRIGCGTSSFGEVLRTVGWLAEETKDCFGVAGQQGLYSAPELEHVRASLHFSRRTAHGLISCCLSVRVV